MDWVLFDQNGTLLDPRAIARPLGVDPAVPIAALDDAVMQAMADTLSGGFRPFPEYLEAALARRLELRGHDAAGLDEAMEVASHLPPFEDASAAIGALKAAGLRVGVLTNSGEEAAREALAGCGLLDRLDDVIGADAVGAYKPDLRVYRHALERIGCPAASACLVAAHGWDLLGAHRAGMRTAWVARKERVLIATVPAPDIRAESLEEAARALAG